jgi:hypothetical protein
MIKKRFYYYRRESMQKGCMGFEKKCNFNFKNQWQEQWQEQWQWQWQWQYQKKE